MASVCADGTLLVDPPWLFEAGPGLGQSSAPGGEGVRCCGAELKAVSCQPVVCRGLITQTPMEKLLEGN